MNFIKIDDSHRISSNGLFFIYLQSPEDKVKIVYDFGWEKIEIDATPDLDPKSIQNQLKGSLLFKGRGPQFLIVCSGAKVFMISKKESTIFVDAKTRVQFEDEDDATRAFLSGFEPDIFAEMPDLKPHFVKVTGSNLFKAVCEEPIMLSFPENLEELHSHEFSQEES